MLVPTLSTRIDGLYIGRAQVLPGDSRSSAIFKARVDGPLRITATGIEGDEQADRRVHGGPEKAVHQFALANYARLAEAFPDLASAFVAGAMGENVSTPTLDENDVCIGDVYALGTARVQLSQPRAPCWKIDARFGLEGIAQHVERKGIAGWYYRVLDEGTVRIGDALRLLDRTPGALSLRAFNDLVRSHRPHVSDLLAAARQPGLAANWADTLRRRARWLHDNTLARSPLPDE